MPMRLQDYPSDWPAISRFIRFERAKGRCETCGVKNHIYVLRDATGNIEGAWEEPGAELETIFLETGRKATRIVLTTAHTCECHPKCGNPDHLKAECQRCHLRRDAPAHRRHRAANRRLRQARAGQGFFLHDIDE